MKKLLSLLGAIGLTATTGATVVACGQSNTQTSLANDVVTSQNYQVSTQNLQTETQSDEDLITKLENHLRGYLDPLLLSLIGEDIPNIGEQYELQGITASDIKSALEAIASGADSVQLNGITVVATNTAQNITGSVVLPTVTILTGIDLSKLFTNPENILVESAGYQPTLQEVLVKLNEEIVNSTPEPITLTSGNIVFQVDKSAKRKIFITGNGLYHGTFVSHFISKLAEDISTVITPALSDLGSMGFISRPSDEQLFDALTAKFGDVFTAQNLEIDESNLDQTVLLGRNMLKGEATVTYERTIFNLGNIINTNLGAIYEKPTDLNDLVRKINEINPGLGLTSDLVTLAGSIEDASASIAAIAGSEIVTGIATISWTIQQIDLGTIIAKTNLGALAGSATKSDIVTAINELNGLRLILGRDVTLDISNTETGRTAVVSPAPNSARYIGSATVNWEIKPVLNQNNLQEAMNNLSSKNLLNFLIKAGSSVSDAQTEIVNKIKLLLSKDYWIDYPNLFNISFSEFPSETWLEQPSGNNPWVSGSGATMSFTLDNSGNQVQIIIAWRIDVIA